MSIYEIGKISSKLVMKAGMPRNITAGSKKIGIWPFNRDAFIDADFLSACVIDRPNPNAAQTGEEAN